MRLLYPQYCHSNNSIAIAISMSSSKQAKRPKIDWQAVGGRIRELRGTDTQADFSKRVDVSQSFLSQAERGVKEVGPEILLTIAHEFGKSLEWLLTGEEFVQRKSSKK